MTIPDDGDERAVGWHRQISHRLASSRGPLYESDLEQKDLALLEVEQPHEITGRDRLLDQGRQHVGGRYRDVDAPRFIEEPFVVGMVHPRNDARNCELL